MFIFEREKLILSTISHCFTEDQVAHFIQRCGHPIHYWFLASIKALCCPEKSVVQSQVRAGRPLWQLWEELIFSLLDAFCFPVLCQFHTGVECCVTLHHLKLWLWHHLGTSPSSFSRPICGHKNSCRVQPGGAPHQHLQQLLRWLWVLR